MSDALFRLAARAQAHPICLARRVRYRFAPAEQPIEAPSGQGSAAGAAPQLATPVAQGRGPGLFDAGPEASSAAPSGPRGPASRPSDAAGVALTEGEIAASAEVAAADDPPAGFATARPTPVGRQRRPSDVSWPGAGVEPPERSTGLKRPAVTHRADAIAPDAQASWEQQAIRSAAPGGTSSTRPWLPIFAAAGGGMDGSDGIARAEPIPKGQGDRFRSTAASPASRPSSRTARHEPIVDPAAAASGVPAFGSHGEAGAASPARAAGVPATVPRWPFPPERRDDIAVIAVHAPDAASRLEGRFADTPTSRGSRARPPASGSAALPLHLEAHSPTQGVRPALARRRVETSVDADPSGPIDRPLVPHERAHQASTALPGPTATTPEPPRLLGFPLRRAGSCGSSTQERRSPLPRPAGEGGIAGTASRRGEGARPPERSDPPAAGGRMGSLQAEPLRPAVPHPVRSPTVSGPAAPALEVRPSHLGRETGAAPTVPVEPGDIHIDIGRIQIELPRTKPPRGSRVRAEPPPLQGKVRGGPDG